jgi:hypothetical protein
MKRTTAEANDGNRYTEGNPSLGIPATVVGAEELNNIQEEIVNVVLDAGLTLNGADEDQLLEALQIIIGRGVTQASQAIADNTGPADVTGLVFDKANVIAARILFHIERRDDGQSAMESGVIFVAHDSEADAWSISTQTYHGDAETTFSITSLGQVRYTSNNFGGTGYAGTMRFTEITTVAQ